MAAGRFEGWRREADQVQPGHGAGDRPEKTLERGDEGVVGSAVPVHRAGEDREDDRQECKYAGASRDHHGHRRHLADAEKVQAREEQEDPDGERGNGDRLQIPLMQGGGGQQRR
jgi:hypothetical protein